MTQHAPGEGWSEQYLGGDEASEIKAFGRTVGAFLQLQAEYAARASGDLRRPQHAKIHLGVTNATFDIAADVPAYLRAGPFQPGAEYPATVRFSNASGRILPDDERDLRGIAVRVTSGPNRSNDFLATNYPISHARDMRQFIAFAQAVAPGTRFELVRRLVSKLGPRQALGVLRNVAAGTKRPVASLASETYWSRLPYQLGKAALRFSLDPVDDPGPIPVPGSDRSDPDRLHHELADRLRAGPIGFDFMIQLFVDEQRTSIEDGSAYWDPSDAPPLRIARLLIPQQDIDAVEARRTAQAVDRMGFGPWNGADTFRPLGQLNRARRPAYQASQQARGATKKA